MSRPRPAGYRPVRIGHLELGGDRPVVCVPLVAATPAEALAQVGPLAASAPDLIEWRVDYLDAPEPNRVRETLTAVRRATSIPLLATVRSAAEGGHWRGSEAARRQLIEWIAASRQADALDVEGGGAWGGPPGAGSSPADMEAMLALIMRLQEALSGRPLILSYHATDRMPPAEELVARAQFMAGLGASAVKLVGLAQEPADGLTLLAAADQMRRALTVPFIAIAMGPAGAYTRAVAPLFGSALTFAAAVNASAPGQFAPADLRQAMAALGVACTQTSG